MDAMDIDVVLDALNGSKRVKRSSTADDSVEPSNRKNEVIVISPDGGKELRKAKAISEDNAMNSNCLHSDEKGKLGLEDENDMRFGRVKRSSTCDDSVEPSNRKNEVIVISPNGGDELRQVKSISIDNAMNSNCLHFDEKGKLGMEDENDMRFGRVKRSSTADDSIEPSNRKNEVIVISPDGGNELRQAKSISKDNAMNSNCLHYDEKGNLGMEDENDMRFGRNASLFAKKVVTIAEEQGSSFGFYQTLGRKARDFKINMNQLSNAYPSNYKEKISSSYLPEWSQETNIEGKDHPHLICESSYITKQDHISNPHHDQAFPDSVVSRSNHSWRKHGKGKKKCNSLLSFGETSSSILNQQSYPQSHTGTSNLKLDKSNKIICHGTTLVEIDKLYPDARCCSSHGQQSGVSDSYIASAGQIESDEIFARELQEQFYHETTRFMDMEKVDATIAWSLQQNEDAKAATRAWRGHSNSVLFDEICSNFDCEVDLETRLDLLEAMDDVLENNMLEYDDIISNDSFNDTDYEMQLNLDESNYQHVGSSEINNLPLSLIQNDNNKEACAVCLEIPSVGETMRHLPCLHKFHKMCIDIWLKRKPLCPVCKFNIS